MVCLIRRPVFAFTAGCFLAVTSFYALALTVNKAAAQSFFEVAKPEVPDEVNNYPLDEKFLSRMEAAQIELNGMDMSGDSDDDAGTGDHSPKALAARIERQPKVRAVLEKHGLTAQDYIFGYFALVSSVSAVEAENEEQIVDELKGINPAHIAFGKQYFERIHKLLGE
ncbi:hypothetical protein [Pseudochrobactrum sp. HB0163]|uniref:hypothetical protein n=1 Tax=Pseudochrobactrum sp. HB0163 TaxID=3450708 RepID=UPI003F6DC6BF